MFPISAVKLILTLEMKLKYSGIISTVIDALKFLGMKARLLAHYLPQYHPIPENSEWWGPGFTEWTNVANAKPLFTGHVQPKIPADLGFYDLRLPESRQHQASLARRYGIEGFVYWHYWFGDGKRLLERPFEEVIASKRPDFPFCLAWANQTWSGIWHGCPHRILIEQNYPGIDDVDEHFYALLDAFRDERYIKVNGKNLFLIYSPGSLDDSIGFMARWRMLARRFCAPDFYFLAIQNPPHLSSGYDAYTSNPPCGFSGRQKKLESRLLDSGSSAKGPEGPNVFSYGEYVETVFPGLLEELREYDNYFPCVVPSWDNTPRSHYNGFVYSGSTPDLYKRQLQDAVSFVSYKCPSERIVFIKSWNEWAEGNYLEPDLIHGHAYLEATLSVVS